MWNKTGNLVMTNNKTLTAITFGALLIVFNLIVFLMPIPQTTTFWIAYIFTSVSFLLLIVISYKVLSSPVPLKSKFLNLSLIQITYSYFVAQLALGIILIVLTALSYDSQSILVPIGGCLLSVALLGFTISRLSFTKLGVNEIERVQEVVDKKIGFIKEKQSILNKLVTETNDNDLRKSLTMLSEVIRFSDPMSNESVTAIETNITNKINNLRLNINKFSKETVMKECREIEALLNQRNIIVKNNK